MYFIHDGPEGHLLPAKVFDSVEGPMVYSRDRLHGQMISVIADIPGYVGA